MRVARDPLNAVDGVHMPRSPFLVQGQERGRVEGKHGKGRHERIGSGHLGLATTGIGEAGKIALHQAKECIGRQLFPSLWRNDGHNAPRHTDIGSFLYGAFSHAPLRKGNENIEVVIGFAHPPGIAGVSLLMVTRPARPLI